LLLVTALRRNPLSGGFDLTEHSRGFWGLVHDGHMAAEDLRGGSEIAEELKDLTALMQQMQQLAAQVEEIAAQVRQTGERVEQIWQQIQ
jgi:methyl-accepting chemotaxis protein